jgi:ribosome-associated heat shock protein Hsp15
MSAAMTTYPRWRKPAISKQRRPASEAALLYEEDEDSRQRRQDLVRERREAGIETQTLRGRPTKRDRRRLSDFTGRQRD